VECLFDAMETNCSAKAWIVLCRHLQHCLMPPARGASDAWLASNLITFFAPSLSDIIFSVSGASTRRYSRFGTTTARFSTPPS
jgi:hypothetical protein